jgi:hypothetical protein
MFSILIKSYLVKLYNKSDGLPTKGKKEFWKYTPLYAAVDSYMDVRKYSDFERSTRPSDFFNELEIAGDRGEFRTHVRSDQGH